jgi:hypothetical protein
MGVSGQRHALAMPYLQEKLNGTSQGKKKNQWALNL